MVTAGSFTDMADVSSREGAGSQAPGSQPDHEPRFRPRDQFWPYADLEEEPSDAELARLDPDLQAALLENPPARPFSCTLVFSPFDGPGLRRRRGVGRKPAPTTSKPARATPCAIARASRRTRWPRCGTCGNWSGASTTSEVLIDERPLPFARELWLPLLWYLLPR